MIVLLTYGLNLTTVVLSKSIGLLFPCIANPLKLLLLLVMDLPELIATASPSVVCRRQLVLQVLYVETLLLVLGFKLGNLTLQL